MKDLDSNDIDFVFDSRRRASADGQYANSPSQCKIWGERALSIVVVEHYRNDLWL
jgi:hypothetical protein